ncbi:tryptophan halogenase family protein [Asticcacaulis tiandongensis]|uniref:tryptophan halogenase family protein n=1 Tax=Asticcacaulis tiandongensis TaxID=2565365 RepID=UPI00112CBCC7|nr:tryptophan halogenase family protein [Asticcacaulis tiandongensis]
MSTQTIRKVVIAGGGSAGWCAATALTRLLGPLLEVTLVESKDIGIIGVGEATVPTIRNFHHLLNIDEKEFMRATNGSIKMAIRFENWARLGDSYIHSFGIVGKSPWMANFHHMWHQANAEGIGGELGEYCLEHEAARAGKFQTGPNAKINYAYHLDTALYGKYLRDLSEKAGVNRIEGTIKHVKQDAETGNITALVLETGETVEGDLFIDCTGMRGLLIEQTLKTGYDDWDHWLANDRAIALQAESTGPFMPYTEAIAHADGWRWRIPLQNRVGTGLVYSSKTLSDDDAMTRFEGLLEGAKLTEPSFIKFRTGRRRKVWNKNVIAFGLSSGFIEPLESTNIHLFHAGITRLVQNFPFAGISDAARNHFNEVTRHEVEHVRDFVIMHYKLTERDDSEYWRARRDMPVPDTLAERIALYRENAKLYQWNDEVFRIDSWLQVMHGQRLKPERWHHLGRLMTIEQMTTALNGLSSNIASTVSKMPTHGDFLKSWLHAS